MYSILIMHMSVRRALCAIGGSIFVLLFATYLTINSLWSARADYPRFSSANSCESDQNTNEAAQSNPNKLLFVGCAGFLE